MVSTSQLQHIAYADNWRKQYAGNDEAISYIDSIVSALSDSKSHFMNYRDYYSQFDDEESYNAYVAEYTKENERQQTYGGDIVKPTEIKIAQLKNDAGLIGAACLGI